VQFHKIFLLLQANFLERNSISPGKLKQIDFFRQIFEKFRFLQAILKKFDFPGTNCSFTATSGQVILFLFKSHHFRTYFLYMIRYNNISRPPATPTTPLSKIWRVATPTPRIDAPESKIKGGWVSCTSHKCLKLKTMNHIYWLN